LLIEILMRQKDYARAAQVTAERARLPQDAAGLMELGRFATHELRLFTVASQVFQDTFRAHPDWADAKVPPQPNGLPFTNQRFAAAAAVMAAAGEGDGAGLTREQRAAWRHEALDWLRADLEMWRQAFDGSTPEARADIVKLIADVQEDGWLTSVRNVRHVDGLPADERDAWRKFWAEVEALRRKVADRARTNPLDK
jgi:hypothetical protein